MINDSRNPSAIPGLDTLLAQGDKIRAQGFCPVCQQDNTSGVHEQHCPGKLELRKGLSFMVWKIRVNSWCLGLSGLGVYDLADSNFWDSWNAGVSPKAMAKQVLEENDFPFED